MKTEKLYSIFAFIYEFFGDSEKLTKIVIILFLSVFLQSLEVLFCEGLLLDGHGGDTRGGLGGQLAEEVKEGAGVDLPGHHIRAHHVGVHHLDVRHSALVQGRVCLQQLVKKLITIHFLNRNKLFSFLEKFTISLLRQNEIFLIHSQYFFFVWRM